MGSPEREMGGAPDSIRQGRRVEFTRFLVDEPVEWELFKLPG